MFDLIRKYGPRSLALVALTAAAIASAPAAAQRGGGHGGGGWHGGGWHGGGWGWGIGVGFYDPWWPGYYGPGPYGYYPYYGDPPVTVIQQPMAVAPQQAPAPATYYYCDEPAGYYPYVQNCGKPWRPVPAVPQGAPPQQ
jgi:hypothetical protein